MKHRVLHVYPSLGVGGAEHLLLQTADRLDPARWELEAAVLSPGGDLEAEAEERGVRLHRMQRRPGRLGEVRATLDLFALLGARRPALVHTHLYPAGKYGRVAAALRGVPSVHTLHGKPLRPQPRKDKAELFLGLLSRRILAVSRDVARWARHEVGLPSSRVKVLYHAIDLSGYGRSPAPPPPPGGGLVIGSVGRLHRDKGHDVLLRAAALAARERPDLEVRLVGDGPERDRLGRLAAELGVRARFLGTRSDVPACLAAMHLFVLPSRREGLSLALLEAMAARLPVVVSDLPALHEVLGEDTTRGVTFRAEDPADLARQLLSLARDPSRAVDLGRAARARVERHFSLDTWVRGLEASYEHALVSAARPSPIRPEEVLA